ncbi:class I SAM-dependent methyltransferase [Albidovulum sp.]|uniref:class I SAM-dependent methyltransferase n=1 Tax=Albidovulum sp. TaxID=1872424 RepID=UPI0039B9A027
MSETARHDSWQAGASYDAYMGRWSRQMAPRFLDWLEAPDGGDWLDLGCGTGSLSAAILGQSAPRSVTGVDASEGFVAHAASKTDDPRARFRRGDAQKLDVPAESFDAAVSGLVLNFVPDRSAMLREMARVVRPGGRLGFFVWDYPGGGVRFMREFWRAASALDPAARDLTEDKRFPDCTETRLRDLAAEVWATEVESTALVIDTRFADFTDYWRPFTLGAGPAPGYCAALPPDRREALRRRLESDLPTEPDGGIALTARAWAVKAVVPG